jgi:hypothetical protein
VRINNLKTIILEDIPNNIPLLWSFYYLLDLICYNNFIPNGIYFVFNSVGISCLSHSDDNVIAENHPLSQETP